MSQTHNNHSHVTSNTIFGFWVYLLTDCMMFATFFATYAVLHNNTFGGPSAKELFDIRLALGETIILLCSSFTCGLAMLFAPKRNLTGVVLLYVLTFIFGVVFIAMQSIEFSSIFAKGLSWKSNGFLSSYFTVIGVHSLHIIVGLFMIPVFLLQLFLYGFTEVVLRRLTCLRMYWHFLYLIWIFTFAIVYLIGSK